MTMRGIKDNRAKRKYTVRKEIFKYLKQSKIGKLSISRPEV